MGESTENSKKWRASPPGKEVTLPATAGSTISDRKRIYWAMSFSAAFVVLAWLPVSLHPDSTNIDPSWVLGINLANRIGLEFGTELVFTYGPLGWLPRPLALDAYTITGYMVYTAAIIAVLSFILLYALSARYPLWIAVAATYAVMAAASPSFLSELVIVIAFVLAVLTLQGVVNGAAARWMPVVLGVIGGAQMLVKFGTGLMTVGIALALAVFGSSSVRQALIRTAGAIGAAIGVFLGLWLVSGQSIGAVDDYVVRSLQLATEFIEMGVDSLGRAWEYVAAAGLVAAIALALAWSGPVGKRSPATWGLLILLGTVTWQMFRTGFVRHDRSHVITFFWFIAVVALVIPWRARIRYLPLAIAGAALLLLGASLNVPAVQTLDPTSNMRAFFSDARLALSSDARTQALAQARVDARANYDASDAVLAALDDGPTHTDSYQTTFVWAYDLDWRPVPIFQSYSAYSEQLDQVNADHLARPDGPHNVLRASEKAIDGRFRPFETPRYTYEMMCRFSTEIVDGHWQVLERSPETRCGEPVSLGVVEARSGALVPVPAPSSPDALVVAKIDVERSLAYSLLRRLFKPPPTSIVLDDRSYRIVASHLSGPLLLSIPNWDRLPLRALAIDGANVEQLRVEGFGISTVHVEFFEIPLSR